MLNWSDFSDTQAFTKQCILGFKIQGDCIVALQNAANVKSVEFQLLHLAFSIFKMVQAWRMLRWLACINGNGRLDACGGWAAITVSNQIAY